MYFFFKFNLFLTTFTAVLSISKSKFQWNLKYRNKICTFQRAKISLVHVMYTRFIFTCMTSELAIRVSLILIRLILLLQISDIVDFIFIKHELVVLACLQF